MSGWPMVMLHALLSRSTCSESSLHGVEHWCQVGRNGAHLAAETPGADAEIVALFALFHDSMRENDGHDPEHGARGGALARELSGLTGRRLEILVGACELHAKGDVTSDPTIGCCWDADRLDLPRVGITPDPALMSTAAGRKAAEEEDS